MLDKQSVTVQIYGNEYTLKGEANADYILDLAKYVDSKMNEISQKTSVPATKVAILTALNIADELYRLEKNKSNLQKQLEDSEKSVADLKKRKDYDDQNQDFLKNQIQSLQQELDRFKKISSDFKDVEKKYREEINQLQSDLHDKELLSKTITELEKKNTDHVASESELQKNISELQLEISNLKKNMESLQLQSSSSNLDSLLQDRLHPLFKKIDAVLD
jgi:cell division protein ZapA